MHVHGVHAVNIAVIREQLTWADNCMFKGFVLASIIHVLELGKLGGGMQL